jgi:hypothetical protein
MTLHIKRQAFSIHAEIVGLECDYLPTLPEVGGESSEMSAVTRTTVYHRQT